MNKLASIDRFIPQRRFTNSETNLNIGHLPVESVTDIAVGNESLASGKQRNLINTAKYADNILHYRKALCSAMKISHSKVLKCSNSQTKMEDNFIVPKIGSWPVVPRTKPLINGPAVVLDMPDIDTTTYHHVIDWGKQGHIATIFDGEVHLWLSTVPELACTQTNKAILDCVCWNRDGTKLAVSTKGSKLCIFDGQTLKIEKTIKCRCSDEMYCRITAIEWFESGHIIAGCSNGYLVFGNNYFQKIDTLLKSQIIDLKLSCNDKYLLVSSLAGRTLIFRLPITSCSNFWMDYYGMLSTAWHPWKESILAVGEIDSEVTVWNINNQKIVDRNVVQPYFKDSCFLNCLTFNPLSAELVVSFYHEDFDVSSSCGSNFLTVFADLHTRVDEIQFHLGRVPHALWDGTGTKLATVGADESLTIWNFFGGDIGTEKKYLRLKKKKPTTDFFETTKRFQAYGFISCIR